MRGLSLGHTYRELKKVTVNYTDCIKRVFITNVFIQIKNTFRKIIKELKHTPGVKLNVASRIFVSEKVHVNKNFTRVTNEIFKSSVQKVDFSNVQETSKKIEAWVCTIWLW